MLIFRLFSMLTLVLLNGCAGSPDKQGALENSAAPAKVTQAPEKKPEDLDKSAIDPNVLYLLLTAEIAGQRGQYDVALEGYMEAARRGKDPRFAERAAKIAIYMKDSSKTADAVSLWLKLAPNDMTARKIAALSALSVGDKSAAIEHLNALLKIDPAGFESTLLELAAALEKEKKTDILYDALDAVTLQKSDRASLYFVQALLAMQMKNKELAEDKIGQALKLRPNWDKALVFQAQIAVFSGDMAKAKNLLSSAAVKFPDNSKIKKLLAQVLIKAEDYEQAGKVYQEIVAADPQDDESRFALALVYLQLGRDGKAEDVLNKLLERPEWQYQASFYLGKIEEKRGNVEKALDWFDKVNDGAFVFEASMSSVSLLAKNKQFEEANSRLRLMQEQFPKYKRRLILMQAELFSQQKLYEKAFALLTDALAEMPEQKDLLYSHALMAERVGKLDVLEADLQKILAKQPDDAEALNALGYSLLEKPGRYADAEKYLQHAIRLKPEEAVIIDSYGWLQFKLGNHEQALLYLQRAYAKQQEGEIAAHLAEVLWVLGRKTEAKKLFAEALKKNPENEYLLDFQQRILNGDK